MMQIVRRLFCVLLVLLAAYATTCAQKRLDLDQADLLDVILGAGVDTTIAVGRVRFHTQDGVIQCDSATWVRGQMVRLIGRASIDNNRYRVEADTIVYNLRADRATARGAKVHLWAKLDSLYAIGPEVVMEDNQRLVTLSGRPTIQLNYPDTARMVTIWANTVIYDRERREADARGDVRIERDGSFSHSDRAELFSKSELVELTGKPSLDQRDSRLTGEKIVLQSLGGVLRTINVYDSATAALTQRDELDSTKADSSQLVATQMFISFQNGKPTQVRSVGQAYVWLHPRAKSPGVREINETSGDSLLMRFTKGGALDHVTVFHGAQGEYRTSRITKAVDTTTVDSLEVQRHTHDSVVVVVTDTVRYQADQIDYAVVDSVITLQRGAQVEADGVLLTAHQIDYETSRQQVKAYAAAISDSSGRFPDTGKGIDALQPVQIPVKLTDKTQQLYGDYLEYSLDSKRGRMVTSKSSYETGYFYGERLYRETENVFYMDGGRYTTCNAEEPHFHFYSEHLKLKDQKRLVARPVVLYLGKLPLLAVPYWVFPLEKGRRSGILPFTVGNIESGDRFIRNVGYYWAASNYLDVLGALDYYERNRTLNFYSKFNYAERYVLSGSVNANYSIVTSYDRLVGEERKNTRWTLSGSHSHQLSPTLRFTASGQAQSDRSYYTDFSTNLNERLNRTLSSRATVLWQMSRASSLSGEIGLDNNLDTEAKNGRLPSLALSLPTFYPFGTGSTGNHGPLAGTTLTWRPSLLHSFSESKRPSIDTILHDTTSYLQRKQFVRTDQQMSLSKSSRVLTYLTLNPSFSYSETEALIMHTNGSDTALLTADQWYRFYSYAMSMSASTKIYGTLLPPENALGIVGFRHTLTPTISYSYTPAIDRFGAVKSYIGGAPGSPTRSQVISFGLNQGFQARLRDHAASVGSDETNAPPRQDTTYKVLDLLSVNSVWSYNLEGVGRKWSDLTTTASSSLVRGLTFSASFLHTFYKPGTNELHFFSPYLTDYSLDLTTRLSGTNFLFDDFPPLTHDTLNAGHASAKGSRWGLSLSYSYRESGRYTFPTISSFLRIGLDFLLTPTTSVTYDQYYDISRKKTVNNQVQITKGLTDCWTGNIYWIPTGSNAGYGFRIYANALPFLKLDNSQTPLSTGTFFNQR